VVVKHDGDLVWGVARGVDRILVCALFEEDACTVDRALGGAHMQGRVAELVDSGHLCTKHDQKLNKLGGVEVARVVQLAAIAGIFESERRIGLKQRVRTLDLSVDTRVVQRRQILFVPHVGRGAMLEQGLFQERKT